jgi:hypothetical protein
MGTSLDASGFPGSYTPPVRQASTSRPIVGHLAWEHASRVRSQAEMMIVAYDHQHALLRALRHIQCFALGFLLQK